MTSLPPEAAATHAEWFAWAFPRWPDPARAHAAAAAAAEAVRRGLRRLDAAAAALAASRSQLGSPGSSWAARYADWYWWAIEELRLEPERAHLAAGAAQRALALGEGHDQAVLAARRAAAASGSGAGLRFPKVAPAAGA